MLKIDKIKNKREHFLGISFCVLVENIVIDYKDYMTKRLLGNQRDSVDIQVVL